MTATKEMRNVCLFYAYVSVVGKVRDPDGYQHFVDIRHSAAAMTMRNKTGWRLIEWIAMNGEGMRSGKPNDD